MNKLTALILTLTMLLSVFSIPTVAFKTDHAAVIVTGSAGAENEVKVFAWRDLIDFFPYK